MGRRRRLLIPGAEHAMDQLKAQVIADQTNGSNGSTRVGDSANPSNTTNIKNSGQPLTSSPNQASVGQVAASLGIPYSENNADMKARQAGKIGGQIGGPMVKRLISLAEQQLQQNANS